MLDKRIKHTFIGFRITGNSEQGNSVIWSARKIKGVLTVVRHGLGRVKRTGIKKKRISDIFDLCLNKNEEIFVYIRPWGLITLRPCNKINDKKQCSRNNSQWYNIFSNTSEQVKSAYYFKSRHILYMISHNKANQIYLNRLELTRKTPDTNHLGKMKDRNGMGVCWL